MRTYFGTKEGNIVDQYEVARMAYLVDGQRIRSDDLDTIRIYAAMCKGLTKEIPNPSLQHLLKKGYRCTAIRIYRERHPELSLRECIKFINGMEEALQSK